MFVDLGSSALTLPKGKRTLKVDLLTDAEPGTYIAFWGESKNSAFRVERQIQVAGNDNLVTLEISDFDEDFQGFDVVRLAYFVVNQKRIPNPLEFKGKILITRNVLIRISTDDKHSGYELTETHAERLMASVLQPALDYIEAREREIWSVAPALHVSIDDMEKQIDERLQKVKVDSMEAGRAELAKKSFAEVFGESNV